jgi:YVTN family beta-propeller protein
MRKNIFLFILLLSVINCASQTGIFPNVDLDTTEATATFPNPISVVTDAANNQIVVANANTDILFETGSLAVLSVDATDTDAVALTIEDIIETPNFATQMFFDGANAIYLPYREEFTDGAANDTFVQYTLGVGSIEEEERVTVAADPFGIMGDGTNLFVVSNDVLSVYDYALDEDTAIDLTVAADEGLDDTDAVDVLAIVYDATNDRAFISNSGGKMFVIDLATSELVQAVNGPTSTRNLIINNDILYVIDAITETVMVFDVNALVAATDAPEIVDDSSFLLASITVGNNPYGMTIDAANNRLYVGNLADDSLTVIDTLTYQEIARISLDSDDIDAGFKRDCDQPFDLALDTYNAVPFVFIACAASHDIMVVNTETLEVVSVFPNTEI